jgi:hypothetical protein
VRPSHLVLTSQVGPFYQPWVIDERIGDWWNDNWRGSLSIRRKPASLPFIPQQSPHEMPCDWTLTLEAYRNGCRVNIGNAIFRFSQWQLLASIIVTDVWTMSKPSHMATRSDICYVTVQIPFGPFPFSSLHQVQNGFSFSTEVPRTVTLLNTWMSSKVYQV